MYTNRRLNKAYEEAKVIPLDKKSKFIFFSDCHRGDDSISDEFTRNQILMVGALEYYYKNEYTYVEVGDGDELWEHIRFRHIRSAHTDVFTVMKKFFVKNRMEIIYGNHNMILRNHNYVKRNYYYFYNEYKQREEKLFYGLEPREAIVLKQKNTGKEVLVLHGHQGDIWNDQCWFLSMLALRYFWKFMHLVGFRNPASPVKNQTKRHKIEKNYCKWIKSNRVMLVCGHTHRMKFPNKNNLPYFNTGCTIHSKGITGIEILNNQILLVQWRVQPDKEGVMRLCRNVIRGPRDFDSFTI